MRTVNISAAGASSQVHIGRRGENEATEVVFDFSAWEQEFGPGTVALLAKRYGEEPYPVTVAVSGTSATWVVSNSDTGIVGLGECEWRYTVGAVVVKSAVFPTLVLRDIGPSSDEPPDPYKTWLDEMIELSEKTTENAQAAAASESAAAEDAQEAEAWAVGQRAGGDVASDDPTYQNNAKYYAEVAQQGAEASGFAWFDVNDADGKLYVTVTDNLAESTEFVVNESTGVLEVIIT